MEEPSPANDRALLCGNEAAVVRWKTHSQLAFNAGRG
jgi:hypothetical protein